MSEEKNVTKNIKIQNKDLEILRLNFPHCFDKDGNFQLEKFKTYLTEKEINFSTESYGLEWLGKSYAKLENYKLEIEKFDSKLMLFNSGKLTDYNLKL